MAEGRILVGVYVNLPGNEIDDKSVRLKNNTFLARCSSLRECLENQACVNGVCVAKCRGVEDCPAKSACKGGICVEDEQCSRHRDCGSKEACIADPASGRRRCTDVCTIPNICGKNAGCSAGSHKAHCKCPRGFYGNPDDDKVGCVKKQCERNSHCPDDQVCQNYGCVPPPEGKCYSDRQCKGSEIW